MSSVRARRASSAKRQGGRNMGAPLTGGTSHVLATRFHFHLWRRGLYLGRWNGRGQRAAGAGARAGEKLPTRIPRALLEKAAAKAHRVRAVPQTLQGRR